MTAVDVLDDRWARQVALPGFGRDALEQLRTARVVVVGAGGVGSAVLPALAAAGVGTLVVVDDDVVELSNLHRQTLHGAKDVGRPKVESAVDRLSHVAIGTVTGVSTFVDQHTATELLRDADLVIDATDSIAARYALDDAAAAAGIPLVWGSAQGTDGQVGVAWAARGPRWRDLFPMQPDASAVDTCETAGVLPTLCTTIGGLMATEAIKLLTGYGTPLLGRMLVVDALDASVREITYAVSDAHEPPAPDSTPFEPAPVVELDAPTLADLLESDDNDVQLVDVREPWEAEIAALPGAILIPLGQLPDRLEELDRARPVVTFCHAGVRSAMAAEVLAAAGFRVRSLRGGIDAWSRTVDTDVQRY